MTDTKEKVLNSWIELLLAIDSERVAKNMPFNEAIILNLLNKQTDKKLTATDLCEMTGMLKSQMNRTLNAMEQKQLIEKQRDSQDRRQINISLSDHSHKIYEHLHHNVLDLVDRMVTHLSKKQLEEVISVFEMVAGLARKEVKK